MFVYPEITHTPSECNIALIAGGKSNEREISLKSSQGAHDALVEAGYLVDVIDPSNKQDIIKLINNDYNFAFLCLHGKGGEDGAIQGFLETLGIPYTGSGIISSALCMDKAKAKLFYELAGIPTPSSLVLFKEDDIDSNDILSSFGGKVVIKVPTEGSSIGVYIVSSTTELEDALKEAFTMTDELLIEQFIKGREFTSTVFGSEDKVQAFPVIEILPMNETYDFESKYAPGGCKHICPAEVSEGIALQMQEYAAMAQIVLGCSGATRTDFLLDENNNIFALETNTIPGMTPVSLLPDAAKAAGITFPDLCKMMVEEGLNTKRS